MHGKSKTMNLNGKDNKCFSKKNWIKFYSFIKILGS